MVRQAASLLKETFKRFNEDDGLRLSAALAYYSAFSIAPLLLIAVSIAGMFFGEEAVRGSLRDELYRNIGDPAAAMVEEMLVSMWQSRDNARMSLVGGLLLLMGAAGFFLQLQAALNQIWSVTSVQLPLVRKFIRMRLLSFTMVLFSGVLLMASTLLTAFVQGAGKHLHQLSGLPVGTWIASSGILSLLVTLLLFAAVFKILPDAATRWRDVWIGALFTSLMFNLGKFAIGWYLGREATASPFGSAASFAALLSWLYYSSVILLFGAEFTVAYSKRKAT